MRMIICGSRCADRESDYHLLKQYLFANFQQPPAEIVSGKAKGGDAQGERLAAEFGIPVREMPADWNKHGQGAGFIRNGDMAVYASEVEGSCVIALWDGQSPGTKQMLDVAKNYGLTVHVIPVPPGEQLLGPVVQAAPQQLVVPTPKPASDPYIFPQSHSSLEVFETCPRQYEAKYLTKEVPFVQSKEAAWGDQVHAELEQYLKTNGNYQLSATCLDPSGSGLSAASFQRFGDWVLNRAAKGGGTVIAERKAAVNRQTDAVAYNDKSRWMGGKIDVTILYLDKGLAEVFDWKTGKVKNNQTQLRMYAALTLSKYREVGQVSCGYVWLAHNQISPPSFYCRSDYWEHWDVFRLKYERLQEAYRAGVFPPKPNGLCRQWCDVKSCEYHGKGR